MTSSPLTRKSGKHASGSFAQSESVQSSRLRGKRRQSADRRRNWLPVNGHGLGDPLPPCLFRADDPEAFSSLGEGPARSLQPQSFRKDARVGAVLQSREYELTAPSNGLSRFLFGALHGEHARSAFAEEIQRSALPGSKAAADIETALRSLGGRSPIPIGTLESGKNLSVDSSILLSSGLVIGATGAGKTRFLVGLLLRLLERHWNVSNSNGGIEIELVDPKYETYDLLRLALAALWLKMPEREKEKFAARIRVIDWHCDWITPSAPFERIGSDVSDAFLARLRADVAAQASPQSFTDAMRHAYFMLARLLIEKQFPMNYRFTSKVFRNEAFRKQIASGVPDSDVRAYFLELDKNLPKQTSEALLRRIQEDLSFPEIRFSEGIPPADLRKLLPRQDPWLVLGNYGSRMSLPPSKAVERANNRIVDLLLRAPRRNAARPGLLILEEAPTLLSRSSDLVEPLTTATRTLRSVGMGIVHVAQDFSNALPPDLVRTLVLNVRWMAMFRAREDADLIYPHVISPDASGKPLPEAERRRAFAKTMESLASRRFYFHAKGYPALPASSLPVGDLAKTAGVSSDDELRDIFNREIASRWVVPSSLAARLIAEWEAEVVDREEVAASPQPKGSGTKHRNFADLWKDLGKEEDAE